MNPLEAAKLIAQDTGDYQETQSAIYALDQEAKITDGGRESAIEVAARLLAEHCEKLSSYCESIQAHSDFLAASNRDLMEKHKLDEALLVHRTDEIRHLQKELSTAKELVREGAEAVEKSIEDTDLLNHLDLLLSTGETQQLFRLPTRAHCGSIREALRVATSCHVPEEASQ